MAVKLGSSNATFKVGSSNVSKIYKGSDLVYSSGPQFSLAGYTRLWCVSDANYSTITGTASSDGGKYAVKWSDNTIVIYDNGTTFMETPYDLSPFNHGITFNGNAAISTTQSKWGGSSLFMDSNSWVSISPDASFDLADGDYTVEFWLYPVSFTGYGAIFSGYGCNNYTFTVSASSLITDLACVTYVEETHSLSTGQWYHIAFTRENGTVRVFQDGVQLGSDASFNVTFGLSNTEIVIGGNGYGFDGYLDDLRVIKGTAIYTSNFSPPAAPLTSVSNTSLLLNFDLPSPASTRAFEIYPMSSGAIDNSNNDYSLFLTGSPTSTSGLISGALSFDGVDDGLYYPDNTIFNPGSGSFTANIWIKTISTASPLYVMSTMPEAGPYYGWQFFYNITSTDYSIYLNRRDSDGNAGPDIQGTTPINDGNWHMVTYVEDRVNEVAQLWIDGVKEGEVSSTGYGPIGNQAGQFTIGHRYLQSGYFWDGSLDEIACWSRPLSQSEVENLYNSGNGMVVSSLSSNLIAYWALDNIDMVIGGQFDGFNVSNNNLSTVRAESVSLGTTPGYYYYSVWVPGTAENGDISDNNLSAVALDQFYTDLDSGTGDIFVTNNPGIVGDDPTIATNKGYTVFGSVPPSTTLLLNFNGNNGDTTTTDSSPEGHIITFYGDAEISTTQSKWGGSSLYVPATGGGVNIPEAASLELEDQDFTLELWWRPSTFNQNFAFLGGDSCGDTPWSFAFNCEDHAPPDKFIGMQQNCVGWTAGGPFQVTPSAGTWHHVAITREGTTLRAFFDGVLVGTGSDSTNYVLNSNGLNVNSALWITSTYGDTADGYFDDVRIIKGHALYTGNFTPPTTELGVYTWTP